MRLSIKQKKRGVVNVYEVKMTVYIHHQSEVEAKGYLYTAMEDWGANGAIIAGVNFDGVEVSDNRFFVSKVIYPEQYDILEEMK